MSIGMSTRINIKLKTLNPLHKIKIILRTIYKNYNIVSDGLNQIINCRIFFTFGNIPTVKIVVHDDFKL